MKRPTIIDNLHQLDIDPGHKRNAFSQALTKTTPGNKK
jgi:hypothetical protein